MIRWCFSFFLLVPWTAAHADPDLVTRLLRQDATPAHFEFCHGGGCVAVEAVSLREADWDEVEALFSHVPDDADEERARIADAIGLLEFFVGRVTGTSNDVGGTFEGFGMPGQLDCIDESTNTTNYLKMLRNRGLLRFHEVGDTHTRGFFLNGWPHTAASVRETGSKAVYIVDSWFYDNGEPAVILPLQRWQDGWKPDASAPALPPLSED